MVSVFKKSLFRDYRLLFGLYALIALIASIKTVFLFGSNNYRIFYYSLKHLMAGVSLYNEYPAEYEDHYHYAPTFATLFAPVFALPYSVGLFVWHFLFAGVWILAVYRMPLMHRQKAFAYWFALQEMLTALVNSQTNPLIAAIPLFAFVCFEKRQPFWAAFFIVLGFEIKIYSIVAGALFLLYPQKGRFLTFTLFWGFVLSLFPLLLTTPAKLLWQYERWFRQLLIKSDHDKWANTSIHKLIHLTLSPDISTAVIVGGGILLFCTVYVHVRRFEERSFRMLLLASVLIFQVIFNPVSESATYITAVTGVLCWWFVCPQTTLDRVLLVSCFILTVLSPSDLFPAFLRDQFTRPYALKALPCVLVWFRVLYLMHTSASVAQPMRRVMPNL